MLTPPDPVQCAVDLEAHQSASLIPFEGKTLRYNANDHARVSGFTGGEIVIQGNKFVLTAVKAVSLREAFDNASEMLAGV